MEAYFLKCKSLEFSGLGLKNDEDATTKWVDDGFPEALAEVERLKTLAEVQGKIRKFESINGLNINIANMILEACSSFGAIFKLPFRLIYLWISSRKINPPAALGGKQFNTVIKAYGEGGFADVDSLLKAYHLTPKMMGDAYAALGRQLMHSDKSASAEAASKAFEADPKPYRLKWLAFRTYEAGEMQRAEAMLALLPKDMVLSESEMNKANQIFYEAKSHRVRVAKQRTKIVSKQRIVKNKIYDLEKNVSELRSECYKISTSLNVATTENERLRQVIDLLEAENNRNTKEKNILLKERDISF